MKRHHPLRSTVRKYRRELQELCAEFTHAMDDVNLTYYSSLNDRRLLRGLVQDLSDRVDYLLQRAIRESVEITINHTLEKTNLTLLDRLDLEVKIENQLKRQFKGKTLQQRIDTSNRVITSLLMQEYNLILSGIRRRDALKDVIDATGTMSSAWGWNNRLLTTEILRSYHYAILEFARETNASRIQFIFDDAQLKRRKEYQELANGGPYQVDDLPDYPRPNASYLLELFY